MPNALPLLSGGKKQPQDGWHLFPILLHLPDGRRVPVDPAEIYLLETAEGDTSVRPRSRRRLRDVRRLGDLVELLAPHGFVQIHRSYAVNLRRVREIRPVDGGGLGGADGPAGQPGAAGEPA